MTIVRSECYEETVIIHICTCSRVNKSSDGYNQLTVCFVLNEIVKREFSGNRNIVIVAIRFD